MRAPEKFVQWCYENLPDTPSGEHDIDAIYTAAIEASGLRWLFDDSPCDHIRQSCADVGCVGPMTPEVAMERLKDYKRLEARVAELEAEVEQAESKVVAREQTIEMQRHAIAVLAGGKP